MSISHSGTTVTLHDNGGDRQSDIDLIYSDLGGPNGDSPFNCGCRVAPSGPGALADFLDSDRDQVIEAVLSCPVEALLLEFDNGRTITSRANEEGGLDKWLRY